MTMPGRGQFYKEDSSVVAILRELVEKVGSLSDPAGTATIYAYLQLVMNYVSDIENKLDDPLHGLNQLKGYTQIKTEQSGVGEIIAGASRHLHIDSGTNGAEILGIVIEGLIGHDWTLNVYVPAVDGEAAIQAQSKRDAIPYKIGDTEGGLLKPFAIPFDCYLDFINSGANDQIDQVTVVYRSTGTLTCTWET